MPQQQHNESKIQIDAERQKFIDNQTNCLILGGPGSGKTTIALMKSAHEISNDHLSPNQKILFLSFARATISRVIETSRLLLKNQSRRFLEINTYHGFCWSVLRSHGYLIGLNRKIKLISPADAAAHLAEIRTQNISLDEIKKQEKDEIYILAFNEGVISFDLFAELTAKVLRDNPKLTKIICRRYPVIILDEFQDTNTDEWDLIKELGKYSRLIALADPNQRIYEFRGADQARIRQFMDQYTPEVFDFKNENNRSPGTDITKYGNDILNGSNKTKKYSNVIIKRWKFLYKSPTYSLRVQVIESIRRLRASNDSWSLAVLVPTKRLMLSVSDALNSNSNSLPIINHTVSIDTEGPTLAARLIAFLMEPISDHNATLSILVNFLITFYRGKGGNKPTATDLKQSINLKKAIEKVLSKGVVGNSSIIKGCDELLKKLILIKFQGNPEKDWLIVRQMLRDSNCIRLQQIAEQASYIRLMGKGTLLRENLSAIWRRNGSYFGAMQIVEASFIQEHFTASVMQVKGVIVMNMHKAKGKEFDEVILYENQYQGRYFSSYSNIDQARLNLRVSVTRARQRTTILTPDEDPCRLLF